MKKNIKFTNSYNYHVIGIGNAIVDILSYTDDNFLKENNLIKGSMTLVGPNKASSLYKKMGSSVEISGGSAANTIAGIAALGGKTAFIGKVGDDSFGAIFEHDVHSLGVVFKAGTKLAGTPTARSLILVTPDAQRTMNTFLGASQMLSPDDVDGMAIRDSLVTYLEGYLWDLPNAKKALLKAIKLAHGSSRSVALTLSDTFCVNRYRSEFKTLVETSIDILFANEQEIKTLYEVDTFEKAVQKIQGRVEIAILTRSEKGSVIVTKTSQHHIPAKNVLVADTTGAGDLYAAGFLYALTHGYDLLSCGLLATDCAAEAISHLGARPQSDLKNFLKKLQQP